MALGDTEHDRACPEQGEIARVDLTHFFKCPANARITRQSLAAIGRLFKRGNRSSCGSLFAKPLAPGPATLNASSSLAA